MLKIPLEIKTFYDQHKDTSWSLSNSYTHPEDIFIDDTVGWIQIKKDIESLNIWEEESSKVDDFYVKHRSGSYDHSGWLGCCLHGLSITDTEFTEDSIDYHWTELARLCPTIVKFWKDFPVERFKRLRFMKLAPNGYINVHNDLPNNGSHLTLKEIDPLNSTVAINLAITHPQDCFMIIENSGIVPWAAGDIYIINNTKNHCVINNSNQPRIHMIAECIVGNKRNEFISLIKDSIDGRN